MVDEDRLAELFATKASAIIIAKELGISRQRLYQLAKKRNHKFLGSRKPPPCGADRKPRRIFARLMTGGVPIEISTSAAGKVAELLVAADLVARGWNPYFPLGREIGHDLIAVRRQDRILKTFEVRTGRKNLAGTIGFQQRPRDNSDHYALVVTGEPVVYVPDLPGPLE